MANSIVQLPLDLTGTSPNNLIGSEEHLLTSISGFPYRIITMEHGGFYSKSLKVFDEQFNRLRPNVDFIWTYRHKDLSARTGRDIASAIVFLNHTLQGKVFVQAQMVGGDLAFSFTVVEDYIAFYNTNPHVPEINDYDGAEPIWGPGELANKRWGLDKYQPFNNELEKIGRAITRGATNAENNYRVHVRDRFDAFMARFNDRLQRHIDDKNDPHEVTPEQVDLGLIGNFPVATQAGSDTGTANDHLMTPMLAWTTINRAPMTSLDNHIARRDNPHVLKPENVIPAVDPKQTQTNKLNGLHNKTDTVDNTLTVFWAGKWMDSTEFLMDHLRKNLDTSTFSQGVLEPDQITYGQFGPTRLLRGDGSWADIMQLQPEYGTTGDSKVLQMGPMGSTANAIAVLNASFSNLSAYPIGTVAFFTVYTGLWQGQGNGAGVYYFNIQYAAGRTTGGWRQL
uniref:Virion structural protein n=1 Tax=Pseudomonas phage RVTF4 TaxID=3236931 RepID=A0AB39CD60_9VIRU